MTISLCCIATRKYKKFVQPLIDGVKKYLLLNHNIEVHLFTDMYGDYGTDNRVQITQHLIPSYGFPDATLRRFEIFTALPKEEYDEYIIYSDIDMGFVAEVGEEILEDGITVVFHPGYFSGINGRGTWETNKESKCFTSEENRVTYVAGGFNLGKRDAFYEAMTIMRDWILEDGGKGIIPIWNDESALNKYITVHKGRLNLLNPSYCLPEAQWKREAWGLLEFEPKILALEKEKDIRE